MDSLILFMGQWGIGGIILLGCGWYIRDKDRQHRSDRRDLHDENKTEVLHMGEVLQQQHREALDQAKENMIALNNNTTVLTELKTIIKTSR